MSLAVETFEIQVRHGSLRGVFAIDEFIAPFQAMAPSLHRHSANPALVDVDALAYTTERLPQGIHRIREVLVQADVPDRLPQMAGIARLETPARRRATFQVGEEIIIVVAREGVTELLDLVSLLTSYAIEAQKIHALLKDTELLEDLRACPGELAARNRLLARTAFQLGTTDDQIVRLDGLWGGQLLERLVCLADHPPHFLVRLHRDYSPEAARSRARLWARRIHQKVMEACPGDRPVHILSSNTHSTLNLLSTFVRQHGDEIWSWALAYSSVRDLLPAERTEDLLYFVMREWLAAFPERKREKAETELAHGIHELEDVYHVGLFAQVLDLSKVDPAAVDPRLRLSPQVVREQRPVLINFEYAFGEQAGIVVDQLFQEFKDRVASFSIMGKAGTVVGQRGGIMLPTWLLKEGSHDVYDFPFGNILRPEDFPGMAVHADGPMLTVLGTILQNDDMLRTYRDEWGILGLEMEGIPYIRALWQCQKRGFLRPDLKVAVGYYASDAPLVPGESLSRELSLEGVNATYAINAAILNRLLDGS